MREYFLKAILKNRLPHALIFSGPPGSGQAEMALWLAKALFCTEKKADGTPCEVCSGCRLADKRTHPDLVWISPEEDSRAIKVEQVRALISRANLRPLQALSKLFVVEPADAMNDTAQNAFLKTLEEPEGHTHFVLISYANEKLLSTVRSRAQELRFAAGDAPAEFGEEQSEAIRTGMDFIRGRSAAWPDFSSLTREEAMGVLSRMTEELRDALLMRVRDGSNEAALEDLIREIETLAEFREKISQNVNTKLALSVLWEKLSGERSEAIRH